MNTLYVILQQEPGWPRVDVFGVYSSYNKAHAKVKELDKSSTVFDYWVDESYINEVED